MEAIEQKIESNDKKTNMFFFLSVFNLVMILISILLLFNQLSFRITIIFVTFSIASILLFKYYNKKSTILNVAIWMMDEWVDNNKIDDKFFKYFCIELDGDFIEAIRFLEKNYNIKIP